MNKPFLTAEWRKLVFANYSIDPSCLKRFIPVGTELDSWNGKYYISLVGFMFMNTRLRGYKIPFHVNFPEVNLRFYVRYKDQHEWKRGVVFIREIVPKPALSFVANYLFHERYTTLPMKHEWIAGDNDLNVNYEWRKNNAWYTLGVKACNKPSLLVKGTKEEFITEHFWGYSSVNANKTAEYQVAHPSWEIYPVQDYRIGCDFEMMYGTELASLNSCEPESVFLAEGSAVNIFYKKFL
jgi:uncharacterized protein